MPRFARPGLAILIALCLGSCSMIGGDSEKLAEVRYKYTYAFETFERSVIITPDGLMSVSQQKGTTGRILRVQSPLEQWQMKQIADAFKGWKQLKPYYSVIFGPTAVIEYDGYQVATSGEDDTPANFKAAQKLLDQYAQAALNAAYPNGEARVGAASMPATLPDTQPATRP